MRIGLLNEIGQVVKYWISIVIIDDEVQFIINDVILDVINCFTFLDVLFLDGECQLWSLAEVDGGSQEAQQGEHDGDSDIVIDVGALCLKFVIG